MVHLHKGTGLNIKKSHSKVCRHMDGTRKKSHHKQDSPDPKDKHYILLLLSEYKLLSKG